MAQKYLEKINKASTAEYRNRRKIRLMILIITVAAALFEVTDFSVRSYKEYNSSNNLLFPHYEGFFGLFLMFVAASFGAFAVYGVFSDLTNKQTADVQLSLPMSAKDRYYSKLLAVAKLHILPLLGAGIFVTIAGAIKGHVIMGQCISYLLQLHCVILAEALFVDAICIFCMSCCGAKAEGVYTSIITGLCASMTPFLVFNFTIERFSGVNLGGDESGKYFASFGALVGMCISDTGVFDTTAERITVLIINILLSCLLIFVTFFIYRKRDGRHVGKPMVYDLFMELFMFTGLFTLFTMFSYISSWGIGLTIALIIYLVIRIVAARAKITPKLFVVWLLKFGASFAVFVAIMAAGYFTGGFGHYKLRNDKIKYDTSRMQIHATLDDGYSVENRLFEKSYYIDENTDPDGRSAGNISRAEADEKLHQINAFLDKYYTLENRNFDDFMDMMFRQNIFYYDDDDDSTSEGSVNVYISVSDVNDLKYSYSDVRSNNFEVSFDIPAEKYEDFLKEAQEILPETDDGYDRYYY